MSLMTRGNKHSYTANGYSRKEHQHESENYIYLDLIQDNEIRRLCVKGKSNASDMPKYACMHEENRMQVT
jgi:hypothetical protein